MDHIIETKLKFKKRLHPNFWVRMLAFKYVNIKIGFTFNYKAFLGAYSETDLDISVMTNLSDTEKISVIVYGAALEYCRINKRRIFFEKDDILNGLLMASLQTNENIGKAMSFARMPDWLQKVMDNLPQPEDKGVKKN